jgi:hypothetical protein
VIATSRRKFGSKIHRVFSVQTDWTLTHTSHKYTEQSTIEASIILDGVTPTDSLVRWSPNKWPSVCRDTPVSADKLFWTSNKPAKWTPCMRLHVIVLWLVQNFNFLSVLRISFRIKANYKTSIHLSLSFTTNKDPTKGLSQSIHTRLDKSDMISSW